MPLGCHCENAWTNITYWHHVDYENVYEINMGCFGTWEHSRCSKLHSVAPCAITSVQLALLIPNTCTTATHAINTHTCTNPGPAPNQPPHLNLSRNCCNTTPYITPPVRPHKHLQCCISNCTSFSALQWCMWRSELSLPEDMKPLRCIFQSSHIQNYMYAYTECNTVLYMESNIHYRFYSE